MPSSRASYPLRDEPASRRSPALAGGFFTISATWEALIRGESLACKRQSTGWTWVGLWSLQGRTGQEASVHFCLLPCDLGPSAALCRVSPSSGLGPWPPVSGGLTVGTSAHIHSVQGPLLSFSFPI